MAKRKNAAALFEVIHTDGRFPKRHDNKVGWSLRAPRWFRRRGRSDAAEALPVETIDYASAAPSGPSLLTRLGRALVILIPPMPRFGMNRDPERQTVRFQLSYTAAFIGALAIVAGIGLAYVVGRQTATRPRPALAEAPTDELRNGPANPQVLDIGGDDADPATPPLAMATGPARGGNAGAAGNTAASRMPPETPAAPPARKPAETAARPSSWNDPKGPTTLVVSNLPRQVGLQYVIIQSYPEPEKDLAEAAVNTLNEAGVLCTIEKTSYTGPGWLSVVGVAGFDRVRDSAEFDAYLGQIRQVSDQFGGKSKFKRFDPKPYRWKEPKKP